MTYTVGQRLEAKYNGHVVTIAHVSPDGGIRVTARALFTFGDGSPIGS